MIYLCHLTGHYCKGSNACCSLNQAFFLPHSNTKIMSAFTLFTLCFSISNFFRGLSLSLSLSLSLQGPFNICTRPLLVVNRLLGASLVLIMYPSNHKTRLSRVSYQISRLVYFHSQCMLLLEFFF